MKHFDFSKYSKKELQWRIVVTAVCFILLMVMYRLIWGFSDQDGEHSGSLSLSISQGLVRFWDSLTHRDWSDETLTGWALYFEHPIRKLAHFGEYAVMGMLIFGIWRPWFSLSKLRVTFSIVWGFLSASIDEIHQTFIDGRDGNFWDVLLDTCGCAFGILFCIFVIYLVGRHGVKRAEHKEKLKKNKSKHHKSKT